MKTVLAFGACLLASACVVTPQTVVRYDAACDIEYKKMVLTLQPLGRTGASCSDNCGPLAAFYVLLPPASAVVSGSVVLVGNTVYWIERRRDCLAAEAGA